jgi:hypothetical protein
MNKTESRDQSRTIMDKSQVNSEPASSTTSTLRKSEIIIKQDNKHTNTSERTNAHSSNITNCKQEKQKQSEPASPTPSNISNSVPD